MYKRFFPYLFLLLLVTSCKPYKKEIPTGTPLEITNATANAAYPHAKIKNVLLLPIDNYQNNPEVERHRKMLSETAVRSFAKFNYFHIFSDPNYREEGYSVIDLQTNRIDRAKVGLIGKDYHVDGVLQITMDEFSAYPPMRMKVKATLFDAETGEVIWCFDHTFDTDDVNVVDGMRIWWNQYRAGSDLETRFQTSELRPSFFANYVFHRMANSFGLARIGNVEAVKRAEIEERRELEKMRRLQKK